MSPVNTAVLCSAATVDGGLALPPLFRESSFSRAKHGKMISPGYYVISK
jgi:hypothetical protein